MYRYMNRFFLQVIKSTYNPFEVNTSPPSQTTNSLLLHLNIIFAHLFPQLVTPLSLLDLTKRKKRPPTSYGFPKCR